MKQLVIDCLTRPEHGEEDGRLWARLNDWALAQSFGKALTPAQIDGALDAAAKAIPELKAQRDWRSAGRYFRAKKLHDLAPAACRRGI